MNFKKTKVNPFICKIIRLKLLEVLGKSTSQNVFFYVLHCVQGELTLF